MTKWIVIGLIIFFVITGIVVPCVLLLGPDNNEDPTTSSPTVAGNLKFRASLFSTTRTILNTFSLDFILEDSIIFKTIEKSIKQN